LFRLRKISFEYFSITRRNYIEAKYVQKSFLRPLPASNQIRSSARTIRRWSIIKNSLSTLNIGNDHDDDLSVSLKPGNRRLEFLNRSAASFDNDPIIGMNGKYSSIILTDLFFLDNPPLIWDRNVYLYEGARHRSVPMMLHALALGAEKNFANEYDHKRTPLIQTILSVSFSH
jgi:hypothetical protein